MQPHMLYMSAQESMVTEKSRYQGIPQTVDRKRSREMALAKSQQCPADSHMGAYGRFDR